MKKVLVLGGTRFFGKRLVNSLIADGAHVTIATRGRMPDDFDNEVNRLQIDRNDLDSLRLVGKTDWDLVYDNLCYSEENATHVVNVLEGKTAKYIVTSSRAVYTYSPLERTEDDFNPYTYEIRRGTREDVSYEEGKRQAEAVLFQTAKFPVIAVRYPIVLGKDDYTRRLHMYVEWVREQREIIIGNPDARQSFIDSAEAAAFLKWTGDAAKANGPYNACSEGEWTLPQILEEISSVTGKPVRMIAGASDQEHSPFALPAPYLLNTQKAKSEGYVFSKLSNWLVPLIHDLAIEQKARNS
ncbi:NAD-dependent epimerase/dehydratase family protein [Brevibacillus ruminantium]|uniref:NAD-dependent epimerase/dehydratase family protein n=1 Tax=Brevibacillus ruminantium TaxID=2950604 RepID=A0ABY4WKT5_9BACL|nr:NAD-dependent epimerase/dehydratase family protein [Brevibacillus ruminantium]USG67702.1 NAD-dependent epimerase/dehydratase family protein [Brevibacillus ruminantium]